MRKGGLARLLGTIYIRQCWTEGHINTWPVAQTAALWWMGTISSCVRACEIGVL
jgi:hypothetical protein